MKTMNKLRKFNSKYMFLILVFIICFIGLFVYLKGDMYKCEILSEDEFATLKTWTVEKDNSKVKQNFTLRYELGHFNLKHDGFYFTESVDNQKSNLELEDKIISSNKKL